ncbi:hypothetical protein [Aquisalimonas sp.]|uniref:hypothetical protein n=1 Tax=unclassified Aquisalimonas TaxID=2644645 RepID=UPI0025B97C9F|nr:hypothetical protein [Aquisalimonas sp.]
MNQKNAYLAAILSAISVALGGCFGGSGSSSSSDSDDGGSTEPPTVTDPIRDVSGAESLLYFTTGATSGETKTLSALDADSPDHQVIVADEIANNYQASGRTSSGSSPSNHHPNARNLPLGLYTADVGSDGLDGELTDVHHPLVVYNTPDGHLYRASATGNDPDPQRISSETDAGVVCGAALVPDFEEPLDAVLLYQTAIEDPDGNKTCDATSEPWREGEWKVVRVGDDDTVPPWEVFDHPAEETYSIVPFQDWDDGSAEGFLISADVPDGPGEITKWFTADGTASGTIDHPARDFEVVERVGPNGKQIVNLGGLIYTYTFGEDDWDSVGGNRSVGSFDGAQHAVRVDNDVIMVASDTGQLLRIDGETGQSDQIHEVSEWAGATRIVGATDDRIALISTVDEGDGTGQNYVAKLWSFGLNDSSVNELTTLENEDSTIFPPVQVDRRFPIASERAPEGWIFISDFAEREAVAIHMSGSGEYRIPNAEWWGQTWAPDISVTGREAQRVLLADMEAGALRSRAADDPRVGTEVTFNTPADLSRTDLVGGFDSRTLAGMTTADSDRDMLYLDGTDGNSLTRLTDTPEGLARPVPFF